MRPVALTIPAQTVLLDPVEQDGRWMGSISIEGEDFRIEAYALNSTDQTVQDLIGELEEFAACGDVLATTNIDDRDAYVAIMPKGF